MHKLYLSLLPMLIPAGLAAQEVLWQRDISTGSQDFLSSLTATIDRQLLLSGSSIKPKAPSGTAGDTQKQNTGYDYHIVKLNQQGQQVWEKYFTGNNHDFLNAVAPSQEGGFLLAGTSFSSEGLDKKEPALGGSDIWVIKVNSEGQEEWQKNLGGKADEEAKSAAQAADMGYFVAGNVRNAPTGYGSKDVWIIKLDKSGNVAAETILGGTGSDEVEKIIPTQDGGCLVGIYTRSGKVEGGRLKAESTPNSQQPKTESQKPATSSQTPKTVENFGEGDYWIAKLDKDGKVQWQKDFGGKEDDHVKAIANTDGGYIVAGESRSPASGNKQTTIKEGTDLWILKLDKDGSEAWQKSYSFGNRDVLMSLNPVWTKEARTKGYLLGGYTQAEGKIQKGDETFWMLYLDADGAEVWRKNVEGKSRQKEERLASAALVGDGTYVLAGTSAPELGKESWKVVMLGDRQVEDLMEHRGFSVYPNPAQDYCYVDLEVKFVEAEVSVYDMSGKIVRKFKTMNAVSKIDTSSLPQGTYIVSATTENQKFNSKIVKK